MQADLIRRFVIDDTPIRGQWVSLDQSWIDCAAHLEAEDFARALLGEALTAVCLLAATLKIDGHITLQIRGQGAVHLLVAQATKDLSIRGLVRQNSHIRDTSASLSEIFQADKMVITIDRGQGRPYQGIVPLQGHSIAAALESYFKHSEQLPTHIWLASNQHTTGGLLLQKMPTSSSGDGEDEDAWNRVTQVAATVSAGELLDLSAEDLLFRLFHEEAIRLFKPKPIRFACTCSRQRTAEMIQALGEQEARSIVAEQGSIHIQCEYCNAAYDFDTIDVEQLFNAVSEPTVNRTVH